MNSCASFAEAHLQLLNFQNADDLTRLAAPLRRRRNIGVPAARRSPGKTGVLQRLKRARLHSIIRVLRKPEDEV
jgi:hypothetical protein